MFFVYIIKSNLENYYYVGSTSDVNKRLKQHNNGEVRSTKYRKPYILVYAEKYNTVIEARCREKKIKNSRFEKERIIEQLMAPSSIG